MGSCDLDFFLQKGPGKKGLVELVCAGGARGAKVVAICKDPTDLEFLLETISQKEAELFFHATGGNIPVGGKLPKESIASWLYNTELKLRKQEKNWEVLRNVDELANGVSVVRDYSIKKGLSPYKVIRLILGYAIEPEKIPGISALKRIATKYAAKRVSVRLRRKFRESVERCIKNNKNHPLAFLIDPATNKLYRRVRGPVLDFDGINAALVIEAGHQTSAKALRAGLGFVEALGIQSRTHNQWQSSLEYGPAFFGYVPFYNVGGIPVDGLTLRDYREYTIEKTLPDGKVIYEPLISKEVYDEAIANGPVQGWTAADLDSVCR